MTLHPTSVQIIDRDGNATEIGHLLTGPIAVTGGAPSPSSPPPLSILEQLDKIYTVPIGRMWVSTDAKRSPLPTLWEVLSVPPQRIPRRKWTGRKIRRRTR